ncbi:flagellar biosynthesis protein FlgN [Sphingomonas sp.]|uniref:flagellar biosynthesis protein FlgN n=1 Tax=Sphingomonas sp. TaxID=28214 RepID=UPI00182D5186|nr:flagellar biosynthesis protein FlgN [Sphingomonas sp.]MBA4761548.1 flagellar biosynthesis protein FlgN [Sphingomonas sp.]
METELLDLFRSLASISDEETMLLAQGRRGEIAGLVQAKIRLVGAVDHEVARLDRTNAGWRDALDPAVRAELAELAARLRDICAANGAALKRQIDLSDEMMAEIAADARRRRGSGSGAYGASGGMAFAGTAVPISVNASF